MPDDHAEYFQLTLDFLRIVAEQWPALSRRERARRSGGAPRHAAPRRRRAHRQTRLARADRRRRLDRLDPGDGRTADGHRAAAERRRRAARPRPAISTRRLGGDRRRETARAAADGHPQYRPEAADRRPRHRARAIVRPSATTPRRGGARALLSEAMRPAATLDAWAAFGAPDARRRSTASTLIVARNEHEEATAIALAIREAIETPGATAALVTPDRTLARRVAVELGRWGLAIDDSAGAPLDREPARHLRAPAGRGRGLRRRPGDAAGARQASARRLRPAAGRLPAGGADAGAGALPRPPRHRRRRRAAGRAGRARARAGARDRPQRRTARRRLRRRQWRSPPISPRASCRCLGPLEAAFAGDGTDAGGGGRRRCCSTRARPRPRRDETGDDGLARQGRAARRWRRCWPVWPTTPAAARHAGRRTPRVFLRALMARRRRAAAGRRRSAHPHLGHAGSAPAIGRSARARRARRGRVAGRRRAPTRGCRAPCAADSACRRRSGGSALPRTISSRAWRRRASSSPAPKSAAARRRSNRAGCSASARWSARSADASAMTARGRRFVDLRARARRCRSEADSRSSAPSRSRRSPPARAGLSITEIETLIRDPYAIYARRILQLRAARSARPRAGPRACAAR